MRRHFSSLARAGRGLIPAAIMAIGLIPRAGAQGPAYPPIPGAPGQAVDPGVGQGVLPGPGPGFADPEVLARGPIHEAFATPVVYNPATPLVVPKPPPEAAVNEVPPAQRPEGADVEWIPGYWAWADDRQDYIWVSGVWRDIPPGRQWVPGYWNQAPGGFAWTPGFWAPLDNGNQLNYLPEPPASLESGPNSPPPGDNFAWAPGSWVWQSNQYAWQPGFWYPVQENWIWSPSSYTSTPGGYLYNPGYWDYPLQQRGLPFAPVAFGPAAYQQPSLNFSPGIVLPVAGLLSSLFVRPNYGHYYFGDYYGAAAQGPGSGYLPWFNFHQNGVGYDPFYASMNALNGRRAGWDRAYVDQYRYRVEHREARPLPTFAAQRAEFDRRGLGQPPFGGARLAEPLQAWAGNPALRGGRGIVDVNREHLAELRGRQANLNQFRQVRVEQEDQARRVAVEHREAEVLARQREQATLTRPQTFPLQRRELPRSPIGAANAPRFQSPGLAKPPPHPPEQLGFRPNFDQHQETRRGGEVRGTEVRPPERGRERPGRR